MEQQQPIPWWESPSLRALAVISASPIALGLTSAIAIFEALKNHTAPQTSDVVNVLLAVAAGIGGLVIIFRRIAHGEDPSNPMPPIKSSVV